MMKNIPFLLCFAAVLGSSTLGASDLLEVYELAQINDPILQGEEATKRAQEELKPQAIAQFMPTLQAQSAQAQNRFTPSARGAYPSSHYSQRTYGLSLSQPIFYYREWIQSAKANRQVQAAAAHYAAAQQNLIVRSLQNYFGVLKAQDTLKFAKANKKALKKFLEQTEQRFKVGLIAKTDVEIARAQHDSALASEILADNAILDAEEKLREMTNQSLSTLSKLRDTLSLNAPLPADIEKWVETALQQNYRLQAARAEVESAKADIKLIQAGHLPEVQLNGSVNRSNSSPTLPKGTSSTVGLQLNLPIFSGGSVHSKTRQATQLYHLAQKQFETLYRQIETSTRQSYRGVLAQLSQMAALKQAIVSNASALKATQAAFEVGARTIVDVLNSQNNLIQAEQNYANARYDYVLLSIQLKEAAGILSPEDVRHINAWLTPSSK